MNWLILAILSATSFGFYNFLTKMTADKLSPIIATVLITGTAFGVALVVMFVSKIAGQPIIISKNMILFPILAGLFVGIAELLYLFMFSSGAPITIGNPLVVGGTVLIAVVLGIFNFKRAIDCNQNDWNRFGLSWAKYTYSLVQIYN